MEVSHLNQDPDNFSNLNFSFYTDNDLDSFKERLSAFQAQKVSLISKRITEGKGGSGFNLPGFWCGLFEQNNQTVKLDQIQLEAAFNFLEKLLLTSIDWSEVDNKSLVAMTRGVKDLNPKDYKVCLRDKLTRTEEMAGNKSEVIDCVQQIRIHHVSDATKASDLRLNPLWYKQLSRNWMWNALINKDLDSVRPEGSNTPDEVKSRVAALLNAQDQIDAVIDLFQVGNIAAIYAVGSYLWFQNPRDIDLVVIAAGMNNIMIHNLEDSNLLGLPAEVRVYGLYELEQSAKGYESNDDAVFLRKEAALLHGSAIQIAGHNIDYILKPTEQSLRELITSFDNSIREFKVKKAEGRKFSAKIEKLLYERGLIENALCELGDNRR